MDIFGNALEDFFYQTQEESVWLQTNDDPNWEEMPLEVFFRNTSDLTAIEKNAIKHCKGNTLDIGAGAGAISLILQKQNVNVFSLEINSKACELMQKLGVKNVWNTDIFSFSSTQKFDTILLLMNGIGVCGKLARLPKLLQKLKSLLNNNGQIIFDSSNITYLYGENLPKTHYFGEIDFKYHYKNQSSETFHWLYIDNKTMQKEAEKAGFQHEIIYESTEDEYVMRLF